MEPTKSISPVINISRDEVEKLRLRVQSCGFGLIPCAIHPPVLRGLQEEVQERRGSARFAEQSTGVTYRSRVVSLGPQANSFLCNPQMIDLLSVTYGESFVLTENRSCVTYYEEGDHLGPHLDEPAAECAVTIIVYLLVSESVSNSQRTGLELRVYGEEMMKDAKPHVTISTKVGAIVTGLGARFWHERPMLRQGEAVCALTACYKRGNAHEHEGSQATITYIGC